MNKREQQKKETVELILKVSGELFRELGYAGTSIQIIAEKCGLSKGAMYHHFRSKEEVLERISRNYYELVTGQFLPVVKNPDLSVQEKLKTIMTAARQNLMNTAAAAYTAGRETGDLTPDDAVMERMFDHYGEKVYEEVFSLLLEEGRETGFCSFPGSPLIIARYIHQLDSGMSRQLNGELARNDRERGEENLADIIRSFSHLLSCLLSLPEDLTEELTLTDEMINQYQALLRQRLTTGE